ncbi:MAG: hypothetical protein MJZ32_08095 [Bacteroidaceae bacterium]|nr:hypothetical protein [Bacteroidaceae bacterium]
MKRIFYVATVMILAVCFASSCKKGAELTTTGENPDLPDSIAVKAVSLYSTIHDKLDSLAVERAAAAPEEKPLEVDATFFLPLSFADESFTELNKIRLLGMYFADSNIDYTYFKESSTSKKRDELEAQMAIELNFDLPQERLAELSKQRGIEYGRMFRQTEYDLFEGMMETNRADLMVQFTAYLNVEMLHNFREIMRIKYPKKDVIEFAAKEVVSQKEVIATTCELYEMLEPYYDKLKEIKPLMTAARKIADANDQKKEEEAVTKYMQECWKLRDQVTAMFD